MSSSAGPRVKATVGCRTEPHSSGPSGLFGIFLLCLRVRTTTAAGHAATEQQGPISDHVVGLPTYTLNGVNTHLGLWPTRFPTNTFPVCIIRSTAWLWVVPAELPFRLELPVLRLGTGNLLVFSFFSLGQLVQHCKALPTPRWLNMPPSSFSEAQPCYSLTLLQGSSESACAFHTHCEMHRHPSWRCCIYWNHKEVIPVF